MAEENIQQQDLSPDEIALHEKYYQAIDLKRNDEIAIATFCCFVRSKPINMMRKAIEIIIVSIKPDKDGHYNIPLAERALDILDECMSTCGLEFQKNFQEKNKYINEFIRLVSEKHYGAKTPKELRDRIMDCLYLWTIMYPHLTQVQIVYDKLVIDGVKHERSSGSAVGQQSETHKRTPSFMSEEDVKKYTELVKLSATNKEAVKAANTFLQMHLKMDMKRTERMEKQMEKLRETEDFIHVFEESLKQWEINKNTRTLQDKTCLMELSRTCEELKAEIKELIEIIHEKNEKLLQKALESNDKLIEVSNKYHNCRITDEDLKVSENIPTSNAVEDLLSTSPKENEFSVLGKIDSSGTVKTEENKHESTLDELKEIFTSPSTNTVQLDVLHKVELLKPITVENTKKYDLNINLLVGKDDAENSPTKSGKQSLLKDIDEISNNLFEENLPAGERKQSFEIKPKKIPLNSMKITKSSTKETPNTNPQGNKVQDILKDLKEITSNNKIKDGKLEVLDENWDLFKNSTDELKISENVKETIFEKDEINLIDASNTEILLLGIDSHSRSLEKESADIDNSSNENSSVAKTNTGILNSSANSESKKTKHLSEIKVDLNSLKPNSKIPQKRVVENKDELSITLRFALDKPEEDVFVMVLTTLNQTSSLLHDYQVDAFVSEPCKILPLKPSTTSLEGVKGFGLPTDTIQQIILVFNPTKKSTQVTILISYKLGENPDPIKVLVNEEAPYFE